MTTPRYYPAGSTEGDVEVGFINSVIATARANATPAAEASSFAALTDKLSYLSKADFTSAGGTPVGNFASWNGAAWSAGRRRSG